MSQCIHTIYRDGKPLITETMPNHGYVPEEQLDYSRPDDKERNQDKIWEVRRELDDLH